MCVDMFFQELANFAASISNREGGPSKQEHFGAPGLGINIFITITISIIIPYQGVGRHLPGMNTDMISQ